MKPLHVCIMGPSGVGKSPLSKLFTAKGWDPFRVRTARDENDKTMTKEDFDALLKEGEVKKHKWKRGDLIYPKPGKTEDASNGTVIRKIYNEKKLCVCKRWSFFKVRTTDQCLRHAEFDPNSPMRIEIFAPVLLEMLMQGTGLPPSCRLDPRKLLMIMLNPTSTSFCDIADMALADLHLATTMAVMERARVKGDLPDLGDGLRRMEYLKEELNAWKDFINGFDDASETKVKIPTLECRKWSHFEYRYHSGEAAERERARRSLFKAFSDDPKWKDEQIRLEWAGRLQLVCMT